MALTPAQLIDLLKRTTDVDGWLTPLLEDASSTAVLNALAQVMHRTSLAAERGTNNGYTSLASGGTPGACQITLTRASTLGAGVVPQGYRFRTPEGYLFLVTQNIAVAIGQATVIVPLQSVRQIEFVNTEDDAFAGVSPDHALPESNNAVDRENATILDSTLAVMLAPPPTFAPAAQLLYTASTQALGGEADALSILGQERGQLRQDGEPTDHYRLRVRNVPDVVSPRALVEAVAGVTQQAKLPSATIYEPFDWAPDKDIDDATNASPIVITTALDHGLTTGQLVRVRGVLGNVAANGIWRVTVLTDTTVELDGSVGSGVYVAGPGDAITQIYPGLDNIQSVFLDTDFFDDSFVEMADVHTACAWLLVALDAIPRDPDGLRAFYESAFFDDPVWGYLDVIEHPTLLSGLLAVFEEVERKRAAGVCPIVLNPDHTIAREGWELEIPAYQRRVDLGSSAAAIPTVVFTQAPPPGRLWWYVDGFFGHSSVPPGPLPAGAAHQVRVTYEDASVVTTALDFSVDSPRITLADLAALGPVLRIVSVEGLVQSDGVATVDLVGQFRVLEVTA